MEVFAFFRYHGVGNFSDRELQMETLYSNWLIQDRIVGTTANTAYIDWHIAIGIILTLIFAIQEFFLTFLEKED